MAKRFTATEIWGEDWFLEMPNEYKLFWYYMLSNCDFTGLFKVNVRSFCGLLEVNLSSNTALEHFNLGKNRIRVLSENLWFIEDFFVYQYGTTFNFNNRMHESIAKIYETKEIEVSSIRGLLEVKGTLKEKDKDKDKVKDITILHNQVKNTENGFSKKSDAQGEELFAERAKRHQQEVDKNRKADN